MKWDLWTDRVERIPASSVDQAGGLPTYLDRTAPTLEWNNFLTRPELPTLIDPSPPAGTLQRAARPLGWVLLVAAALPIGLVLRSRDRRILQALVGSAVLVVASLGLLWFGRDAVLSENRTREITGALLHNVYRAFDYRDEEKIYDLLAQNVEGELLTQVYLETRRGLELANQGGARAKVKQIELEELEATPQDGGFSARATWSVSGSVGHWGHLHGRANRYRADLYIRPADGSWKLSQLKIRSEERI